MEDQEIKTFKKKTALVFTTIEITKFGIIRTGYTAKFKAGNSAENLKDVEIKGITLETCIENVSKLLDCEISENHYIIK